MTGCVQLTHGARFCSGNDKETKLTLFNTWRTKITLKITNENNIITKINTINEIIRGERPNIFIRMYKYKTQINIFLNLVELNQIWIVITSFSIDSVPNKSENCNPNLV